MKVINKKIVTKVRFAKTIYIFDYGSPLCKIDIKENYIEIVPLSDEEKIIHGASVVARLLNLLAKKGLKNILSLANDNLMVHFGKHYIVAAIPSRKHFAPVVSGFIRSLNQYLDSYGLMAVEELEKCIVKFLERF